MTQAPVGGAGAGQGRDADETATRIVMLCVTATVGSQRTLRRLGTWAVGRSISPNSLSGISLLFALCAAAWFSGGAGQDGARGTFAMIGWLAVLTAARWLAVFVARHSTAADGQEAAHRFAWLRSVYGTAGECAIYGGMAAGNEAAGLVAIWPLAVGTVVAAAIAELLGACMAAAIAARPVEQSGRVGAILGWTGGLLKLPPGIRGSMALLGFAIAGADGAFFAVLAVSVLPIAITVAMLAKIAPAERRPPAPRSRAAPPPSNSARSRAFGSRSAKTVQVPSRSVSQRTPWPAPLSSITIIGGQGSQAATDVVHVAAAGGGDQVGEAASARGEAHSAGPSGPAGSQATARARGTAGLSDVGRAGWAEPSDASQNAAKVAGAPSGKVNARATARHVLLTLRDDGAAARWAGRLVQGNLIPLPPALAGLVATSMLAVLGVRNLASFIVLTPPVVMMLAAPGSSHPHDRRFDWLVPVLLALAQYVYLAPLGFALALPGPVIFSACAVIFVWYTSVISTGAAGSGRGTSIGWETRMFTIGLATTFGLATFGYVGLATYLGVLICRKVMTGYLVPREEDRL